MNIFWLDEDIDKCAECLCDQHLRKMILETAQLLNNQLLSQEQFYKPTHLKHPCNKWVAKNAFHYFLLLTLFGSYLNEYRYRFSKGHSAEKYVLVLTLGLFDQNFDTSKFEEDSPQCMPEEFKNECIETAYRNYYRSKMIDWVTRTDKRRIIPKWTARKKPDWLDIEIYNDEY